MHKHIIVRQLIYSYKTFALFIVCLFKSWLAKQRMPKQAKSSTAKVKQICHEYPDEFSATSARDLRCNLCDVLVKCDKKFFVESYQKSKQHKENWRPRANPKVSKPFLQLDEVKFKEQVIFSFLAVDILLHVFGWKDIKGIIPFFDACHLRCALTT